MKKSLNTLIEFIDHYNPLSDVALCHNSINSLYQHYRSK